MFCMNITPRMPIEGIENLKKTFLEGLMQLDNSVKEMDLPFKHPEAELICVICPADR